MMFQFLLLERTLSDISGIDPALVIPPALDDLSIATFVGVLELGLGAGKDFLGVSSFS